MGWRKMDIYIHTGGERVLGANMGERRKDMYDRGRERSEKKCAHDTQIKYA